MTAASLKTAIDTAVAAGNGTISVSEAEKILRAHGVREGNYLTVVISAKEGIEDDFFIDLIRNGDGVTGVKIEQDWGQYL